MNLQQKLRRAVEIIVSFNTLPPQIDYVSLARQKEVRDSIELIDRMPTGIRNKYNDLVTQKTDEYYTPSVKSFLDGKMYSVAELDAMF